MIVINTLDDNRFSINGIAYLRRFISIVGGDSVSIKGIYDSAIELVSDNYANFTVNGDTFASAALLQAALVTVLFNTGNSTVEGWSNLVLSSSWVNNGGGYAPASYYKDNSGIVWMRGLIKNGTDGLVCTLPSGYRPNTIEIFPSNVEYLNLTTNKTAFEVQTDGSIYVNGVSGNAFISLSMIRFSINAL